MPIHKMDEIIQSCAILEHGNKLLSIIMQDPLSKIIILIRADNFAMNNISVADNINRCLCSNNIFDLVQISSSI